MIELSVDDEAPAVAAGLRGRRRPKVALTLGPEILARAKARARLEGRALSRIAEAALTRYLEDHEPQANQPTVTQTHDNTTEEPRF